jgi:YD repeat-containing protein
MYKGEIIMKILVIIISALALVFSSCATGQNIGGDGSAGRPGGGKAQGGQIPVETKIAILFADGSLDEYTTTEWDSTFTNRAYQNRYSASGTLLEKVEFAYQEDKGWLTTKLSRDVEDRLKTRIVYQYNEQGLLWKESLANKAGKTVSSYEYGYDSRGNRTSRIIYNATGVKLAETLYTFNNNGQLIATETRDGSGKKINSTENEYDSAGNLVSEKVYNANGELNTIVNSVWQQGHETENQRQRADGMVQLRITNEYGSSGELLHKKIENIQDESTQMMEYEYAFKPEGRAN